MWLSSTAFLILCGVLVEEHKAVTSSSNVKRSIVQRGLRLDPRQRRIPLRLCQGLQDFCDAIFFIENVKHLCMGYGWSCNDHF